MPDSTPVNSNQNHPLSISSSATPPAIVIDGSEEDAVLARSQFLTSYEVLKRRSRRAKQLAGIYRDHYWALMEDVRFRYRDYYWEYGKSPFVEDEEANDNGDNDNNNNHSQNLPRVKVENEELNAENLGTNTIKNGNSSNTRLWCVAHMCKNKVMPLTKFCHMHILFDVEQKLYKPCNFTVKSSPTGPYKCGKPALRSTAPTFCPQHFDKAEKYVTSALKKVGVNVSSTSERAPQFHVIVAEFVRQIQNKRRAEHKSIMKYVEDEDVAVKRSRPFM